MIQASSRLDVNRVNDLKILNINIESCFKQLDQEAKDRKKNEERNTAVGSILSFISNTDRQDPNSSLQRVNLLLHSLSEHARTARRIGVELQTITVLIFEDMRGRELEIMDANEDTFDWLYSESSDRPGPKHFSEWLKEGHGIFWISGKPGSGKSTLMKHIFYNKRTTELLQAWAAEKRLVTANFYFWNAGSSMQKSIDGLLRSLACQILQRCPDLAPKAFPEIWRDLVEYSQSGGASPPNLQVTREALRNFLKSFKTFGCIDTKYCFFIDGLDEYDGFDHDIAQLMEELAISDNMKLCVASRAHPKFVSSFSSDATRMFSVHEFTDPDIRQYIKEILEGSPDFVARMEQDPNGYQKLAEYIRYHASGVFLWVYLVVVSALDSIGNTDKMSDLQRKVEETPVDLKLLFGHILNRAEESYHEQQAQMLSLACQAYRPLSLISFSFFNEEGSEDPNYALRMNVEAMSVKDVHHRSEDMKTRVVARCKLLLTVVESRTDDEYFGSYVTFMHRTVRDYIIESEAQKLLQSRLKAQFYPRWEICKALLAQIKSSSHVERPLERNRQVFYLVQQFLFQAREIEYSGDSRINPYISELQGAVEKLSGRQFAWWSKRVYEKGLDNNLACFLQLIIKLNLPKYLDWRLKHVLPTKSLSSRHMNALLASALGVQPAPVLPDGIELEEDRMIYPDTVKLLLEYGAKPTLWTRDVWSDFLLSLGDANSLYGPNQDRDLLLSKVDAMELLILSGVNLGYVYYPPSRSYGRTARAVNREANKHGLTVEKFIGKAFPSEEAQYLLQLVEQQRVSNPWFQWFF